MLTEIWKFCPLLQILENMMSIAIFLLNRRRKWNIAHKLELEIQIINYTLKCGIVRNVTAKILAMLFTYLKDVIIGIWCQMVWPRLNFWHIIFQRILWENVLLQRFIFEIIKDGRLKCVKKFSVPSINGILSDTCKLSFSKKNFHS